jgi:hypothetical protein
VWIDLECQELRKQPAGLSLPERADSLVII